MRPIIRDGAGGSYGIIRFQENSLVRRLLDESQKRGFGLNQLVRTQATQAEWEEFYQLIGYSLAGYHELSLVSDLAALEASKAARAKFPTGRVGGCCDFGCTLHCGVEREDES